MTWLRPDRRWRWRQPWRISAGPGTALARGMSTPSTFPGSRGRVLAIGGSDSGGGAGIQADIKTVTALGGHASCAVTAVTVQNTLGVTAIHPVPPEVIAAQVRAVLSDIGADAIKTGMLGGA